MQYFMIAILFLILFLNINGIVQNESNVAKVLESTSSLSNETMEIRQSTNENSHHQENEQQQRYSSTFITETDIAVRQIKEDEWPILEKRLSQILLAAFKESTTAHLRQNRTLTLLNFTNVDNPFTVQILGTRNFEGLTVLNFVSFFNNEPVPSEVITEDISLLTLSHLSAALQYPVINIRAQYQIERNEESRWWIVGIVLGSGILIILFGWCCLFVYYNSCGRPIQKYHPNTLEEIQSKGIEIEIPKDVKFKGKRWIEKIEQQNLVNEDKFATPEPLPKISVKEEELQKLPSVQNEVKHIVLPVIEPYNNNNNNEISLPSITEKDEGLKGEIRGMESANEIVSVNPMLQDLSIQRPKTANIYKRTSNDFLIPNEINTSTWSPYQPGDFIAFTYGIQLGLAQYPRPLPSTDTGVIEFGSMNKKHHLTNS